MDGRFRYKVKRVIIIALLLCILLPGCSEAGGNHLTFRGIPFGEKYSSVKQRIEKDPQTARKRLWEEQRNGMAVIWLSNLDIPYGDDGKYISADIVEYDFVVSSTKTELVDDTVFCRGSYSFDNITEEKAVEIIEVMKSIYGTGYKIEEDTKHYISIRWTDFAAGEDIHLYVDTTESYGKLYLFIDYTSNSVIDKANKIVEQYNKENSTKQGF